MELTFEATGSGAAREDRLRRSRRPPTRAFSLILGLIAAALVLGRAGTTPSPEPGRIRWDQESITFDAGNVETVSSRTLGGTNVGGRGMVVGRLRLEGPDAGDFRLEKDGCSGRKLAPGETCRALVVWQSKTPGRKTAQLLLDGEALAEPASVRVEGEAMAPAAPPTAEPTRTPTPEEPTASPTIAEPTASPTPTAPLVAHVRFEPPRLELSDNQDHTIQVVNAGEGGLVVRDLSVSNPGLRLGWGGCKGKNIAPGSSCLLSVAVAEPLRADVASVTIAVFDNAPDSPQSYSINLQSWIRATPPRVDFGSLNALQIRGKLGLRVVQITNVSDSIVHAHVDVRAAAFNKERSNCGEPMKHGDQCFVWLRFLPHQVGSFDGFLLVGDVGRPTVAIPVTGAARAE